MKELIPGESQCEKRQNELTEETNGNKFIAEKQLSSSVTYPLLQWCKLPSDGFKNFLAGQATHGCC